MGTGGPKRFTMQMHSAEIRVIHPEFGLKAFTQLMMDTGGSANVCDPRANTPTKDVVQLNSPCPLTSAYEIWVDDAVGPHRRPGGLHARSPRRRCSIRSPCATRANPSELVYAWDPRMASSKIHNSDWSWFRGCERESYAQPGYWQNHRGQTIYYTDPMGNQVASNHPLRAEAGDLRARRAWARRPPPTGCTSSRCARNYCQQPNRLGLKN